MSQPDADKQRDAKKQRGTKRKRGANKQRGANSGQRVADPQRDGEQVRVSFTRSAAVLTCIGLIGAAVLLATEDAGANDGVAGIVAIMVIPILIPALLLIAVVPRVYGAGARRRDVVVDRGGMWWILLVFPVGILAAVAVGVTRDPDYWLGDSPWALLWMPVIVYCAIGLSSVLYIFVFGPLTLIVVTAKQVIRGEGSPAKLAWAVASIVPALWIALAVAAVDPDGPAQAATARLIYAILGIPGNYEVLSEPLLWAARALSAAVAVFVAWAYVDHRLAKRKRPRAETDRSGTR